MKSLVFLFACAVALPAEIATTVGIDNKIHVDTAIPALTSDMMNGGGNSMPPAVKTAPAPPLPKDPPASPSKQQSDFQPQPQTPQQPEKQTITVDVAKEKKRVFEVQPATNCRNRAHIMSSYIRKISKFECQSKCAFDPSCTGYDIEATASSEGECTIFKGKCDAVPDSGHDLFIERADSKVPESAPPTDLSSSKPVVEPPKNNPEQKKDQDQMLDITIVIPTVRRFQNNGQPAPERYLSPLVQKLWSDMSPAQQKNIKFLILNADKEPEKHTEALKLAAIPSVTILNKPKDYNDQVESALKATGAFKENGEAFLEDGRQVNKDWVKWVASEDLDGAYLLEVAAKQSPYILFLEDDVWPTTKALEKLSKFVQTFKHDDWLFLDLYTPNLDWAPNSLDVRNGERYQYFCCTQAMLFRSDRVGGVVNFWRTHSSLPVDDNLRNYREKVTPDLFIYAVRPNLFEHIGAYSSNPQKSTGVIEHQSVDFVPLLL